MKTNRLIASLVLCLLTALHSYSQQKLTPAQMDTFIKEKGDSLYKSSRVPGIFVGVLQNGKEKYYNFGYADPGRKMEFDSATLFEIGSITKTLTAFVLESVLLAKGIDENRSISSYLPDSVQKNAALDPITYLSLLNHTSGLPRLPANLFQNSQPMAPYDHYRVPELFSYLKTARPNANGKSTYSNLGAGLAGVLAARISGQSYNALLKTYIFRPLRLAFHEDDDIDNIANKSQGYFENQKTVYWRADAMAPAAGLKMSAAEMLCYLRFMARGGDIKTKPLIEKLLTPTVNISSIIHICRAWHTLENADQPTIYWHNGGTYGFSTFAAFEKKSQAAVIVAVNQFNKNDVSDQLGIAIIRQLMK